MRKVLMVLAILSMLIAPAFAQVFQDATGTVDSIDPIDPARGNYDGSIVLRDTISSVIKFGITTATVISDQTTGKIDSGDIQDGDKVKVTYQESDQGPLATTILRLPK